MKALLAMQVFWDQWTAYLSECWSLPWASIVCRPLWTWTAMASTAAGALFLFWAIWKVIHYKLMYRAALRAEAYRQSTAPEEVMAKLRWTGDDDPLHRSGKPDVDVAAQIREELDRRKLQEPGMLRPGPKS